MTCPKSSCHRNISVTFPSLHPARWLWAQWGLMLIAHTRCAVVAGLRCSDGLSSVKRQMYRFCRRFYPTLRFPLLVAAWQHCCLWVGFAVRNALVTEVEVCGCLKQYQTVFTFCPLLSNFLLPFQEALALIWTTSIPGVTLCPLRQWPSSHAFSKYWTSYCPHQRQPTGRDRPLVWLTTAFLIFCSGSWKRQNFFHVSCFQSMEIFVDILTKSICFFPKKPSFLCWEI